MLTINQSDEYADDFFVFRSIDIQITSKQSQIKLAIAYDRGQNGLILVCIDIYISIDTHFATL